MGPKASGPYSPHSTPYSPAVSPLLGSYGAHDPWGSFLPLFPPMELLFSLQRRVAILGVCVAEKEQAPVASATLDLQASRTRIRRGTLVKVGCQPVASRAQGPKGPGGSPREGPRAL